MVRFAADMLNGVPSIVVGIFVYGAGGAAGEAVQALAGGVALGVMMIPIITRTTEELLRLVPATLREGALALGATRARAVFTVVLPAALPGIITGDHSGAGPHRRRNRAAAVHLVQQPLLVDQPDPADVVPHRPGVHLRDFARTKTAPAGVGGRVRAGHASC